MKPSPINKTSMFMVLVVLFCGSASAQTPVYHPGDTIKISVTFAGPDAGKIDSAAADLKIANGPTDQPGFSIDLYSQEASPTTSNTFVISLKIPKSQASGDYKLVLIRGFVPEPKITLEYFAPADYSERTYTIQNPEHFVKPTIKDVH
jgi:hypothetical protein